VRNETWLQQEKNDCTSVYSFQIVQGALPEMLTDAIETNTETGLMALQDPSVLVIWRVPYGKDKSAWPSQTKRKTMQFAFELLSA